MMPWIYVAYVFLCLLQLPVFLFLCPGMGHHMPEPAGALVPRQDLVAPGDPYVVYMLAPGDGRYDWEAGAACAATMLFACVYLHLQRSYEEDTCGCALHQPDAALEWSRDRQWLEVARALFWASVLMQAAAWVAALGSAPHTHAEVCLGALYRAAALVGLTRTSASEDDAPPWPAHLAGAYAYVVLYGGLVAPHATWMLVLLIVADAFLVWAHLWERGTTADVALNARLFYLTGTGVALLLLPLLPPPASS